MEEFFDAVIEGNVEGVMGMLKLYDHTTLDVIDQDGMTPLMYAKLPGIALLLVTNGHKIDTTDILGRTPLIYAVLNNCNGWTFYALIKNGADMTIKDCNDDSALELAIQRSQSEMLLAAWIKTYFDGSKTVEDLDLSQLVPVIIRYDEIKNQDPSMASISNALRQLVVFNIFDVLARVELYFGLMKEMLAAVGDE